MFQCIYFLESLRAIDGYTAKELNLKPGQKLCPTCYVKHKQHDYISSSADTDEFEPLTTAQQSLDTSSSVLGLSPIKPVSQRDKLGYGKRKIQDIQTAAKQKVAKLLDVPTSELSPTKAEPCKKCEDLDRLICLLKDKCKHASRQEQIKLLTLVPASWTIKKTMDEFNVSEHIVKRARELKKNKGILAEPDPKKGRPLSTEVVERVKAFYQSDEYSRMCPGKKEYVSVKTDDGRVQMQKRLLLLNLKELHIEYLKTTGDKIGFSKFCELRPKWCVTVSSRGMHSVCVCEQHQNAKLLVAALPDRSDYKDLLSKMVCSLDNRNCMMQMCEKCPGRSALREYLSGVFSENNIDFDDSINYKQWVHTDRTALINLQLPLEEFLDLFCEKIDSLRQHHFVAKSQSAYLRSRKEALQEDTAIVLLDFAENYSFLIQDAIQGFYWDNNQATLHPFAIYYKEEDELKCMSVCVISDRMKHDTTAVHAFISRLILHLKEELPSITKVVYFSDGAASQYKNYKNFSNLCHHQIDHGLVAEWHFFATSHGKSPCDGLGGTTKRLVARASLQATEEDQILTPLQMFQWADENIDGIKFFFVSDDDVQRNANKCQLEKRYSLSKTVSGTRSHHCFIPTSEGSLEMRRLSADDVCSTVLLGENQESSFPNKSLPDSDDFQPGKYIACMYDQEWYIGNIVERSEENNDVYVKFMKRSQNTALSWPQDRRNECWVPFQDILCTVSVPELQGHGGRQYKLSPTDYDRINALLPTFLSR